jgi:hypothetical protein
VVPIRQCDGYLFIVLSCVRILRIVDDELRTPTIWILTLCM